MFLSKFILIVIYCICLHEKLETFIKNYKSYEEIFFFWLELPDHKELDIFEHNTENNFGVRQNTFLNTSKLISFTII